MRLNKTMIGLLAAALSGLAANATDIPIRVACPNDTTASGIRVFVVGVADALTDELGMAEIHVPYLGQTYTVCVDETTLPAGATLKKPCQNVVVGNEAPPVVEFTINGPFCDTPPPPGPCWLTGGGTIGKVKGVANYSFGGVVYPGCSPKAADGGNWNVVDHFTGLHFQGQQIVVDSCSGVETRSPRVNVNIIDFHGVGIISGVGGNPAPKIPVTFVGRAVDNLEPGAGSDLLYLSVFDGVTPVLQVGTSVDDPAVITTGNLQIHTSSCSN